jgi:hypothetical protein
VEGAAPAPGSVLAELVLVLVVTAALVLVLVVLALVVLAAALAVKALAPGQAWESHRLIHTQSYSHQLHWRRTSPVGYIRTSFHQKASAQQGWAHQEWESCRTLHVWY